MHSLCDHLAPVMNNVFSAIIILDYSEIYTHLYGDASSPPNWGTSVRLDFLFPHRKHVELLQQATSVC